MKREQVKAKVQCLVCSFSVPCGQCRREDVSLQLHAGQLKDRAEAVPGMSPPCLAHPKAGLLQPGKWLCWAEVEHYIQCIQRKHLSLDLQGILPFLGYLMKKTMVSGSWLLTGSCVTSLSLFSEGKKKKWLHIWLLQILILFVKSRNTQRFYKILSRHWSTLAKRNHLSTGLIRQGKKIYHLTANNTLKMSLLCVISVMSEGDKARYVHVFNTFQSNRLLNNHVLFILMGEEAIIQKVFPYVAVNKGNSY